MQKLPYPLQNIYENIFSHRIELFVIFHNKHFYSSAVGSNLVFLSICMNLWTYVDFFIKSNFNKYQNVQRSLFPCRDAVV